MFQLFGIMLKCSQRIARVTPDKEIDFEIELVPDVDPISKAPYRMAPVELKELHTQLK